MCGAAVPEPRCARSRGSSRRRSSERGSSSRRSPASAMAALGDAARRRKRGRAPAQAQHAQSARAGSSARGGTCARGRGLVLRELEWPHPRGGRARAAGARARGSGANRRRRRRARSRAPRTMPRRRRRSPRCCARARASPPASWHRSSVSERSQDERPLSAACEVFAFRRVGELGRPGGRAISMRSPGGGGGAAAVRRARRPRSPDVSLREEVIRPEGRARDPEGDVLEARRVLGARLEPVSWPGRELLSRTAVVRPEEPDVGGGGVAARQRREAKRANAQPCRARAAVGEDVRSG